MKVLLVPFSFHPDPAGGTEVYVEALARRLAARGIRPTIAAPAGKSGSYVHEGLEVRRFSVSDQPETLREMYDEGSVEAAVQFDRILAEKPQDIVHLHSHTRAVSLRTVRVAQKRGIPVVFTYHTPTVTCQRGTLLEWGADVCNGVMRVPRCAACSLHGLGMNRPASLLAGCLPPAFGRTLGALGRSGGLWTALRMSELVELRHAAIRALLSEVDHVVAVCQWVKEVLIRNGVPERKLTLSRQGLCQYSGQTASKGPRAEDGEARSTILRIVFFGRLDPTKGVDLLVSAVKSAPGLDLTLDIHGIAQGKSGEQFAEALRDRAAGDGRIQFRPPIPADEVVNTMRTYDLLAVPSQWMETGPMVILEAFAAGVPVIGSRLGGIAELVQDGVNGLLVESASVEAWSAALKRCTQESGLMAKLRGVIMPPRTMDTVADEMSDLYERLTESRRGRVA